MEVQGDGALIVGFLERCYSEAEGRRKGVAELGDRPVNKGVEGRELGANTREACRPLPDGNANVWKAGLAKDGALDLVGSGLSILKDNSLGRHVNGHKERAEWGRISSICPTKACDGSEAQPVFLEVCLNIPEDPRPGGRDGMAVDGAELANVWLRLWTAPAFGPSWASLVDKWSTTNSTVGVSEGIRVIACEAGAFRIYIRIVKLRDSW